MSAKPMTIARSVARKAYHRPAVRKFYETTMRNLKAPVRPPAHYETMATFTRDSGEDIRLLAGLRDHIKPNWRAMLSPPTSQVLPSAADLAAKSGRCRADIQEVTELLRVHDFDIHGRDVLEIGCYDGIHSRHLAAAGAASVTASDISAYYIRQRPDDVVTTDSTTKQLSELEILRDNCGSWLDENLGTTNAVSFVEDDIAASVLPDASVDAICSWEVLEHVSDPVAAFAHMYRVLRPGGVCYHDYNPFFCYSGGHSLATLDFHWGHARLTNAEFDRYVEQLRPVEQDVDKAFFYDSLNRMSLVDARAHAEAAGLEVMAQLPYVEADQVALLEAATLRDVQKLYPTVSLVDLISPRVVLLLRKPA